MIVEYRLGRRLILRHDNAIQMPPRSSYLHYRGKDYAVMHSVVEFVDTKEGAVGPICTTYVTEHEGPLI